MSPLHPHMQIHCNTHGAVQRPRALDASATGLDEGAREHAGERLEPAWPADVVERRAMRGSVCGCTQTRVRRLLDLLPLDSGKIRRVKLRQNTSAYFSSSNEGDKRRSSLSSHPRKEASRTAPSCRAPNCSARRESPSSSCTSVVSSCITLIHHKLSRPS